MPDRLNKFYARFDRDNLETGSRSAAAADVSEQEPPFVVYPEDVVRVLSGLNVRKAAGPDRITPRLLRSCSRQLADILAGIFNWSLNLAKLPQTFKDSIIVPVPKRKIDQFPE